MDMLSFSMPTDRSIGWYVLLWSIRTFHSDVAMTEGQHTSIISLVSKQVHECDIVHRKPPGCCGYGSSLVALGS